jgi:ABC-type Fe3+-hydroxamate transport system substrate-binding protein
VRVVSLVPSATETLRAWGRDPIACSRFCEQPDLPQVGGTKDPDVDAIVALAPDLVVVDREENRREDHDALVAAGVPVHVLHVVDLAHLDEQMAGLADAVGATWQPLGPVAVPPVRARAWVPIWRRPWMALGAPTYGTEVLRAVGLENVAAADGPYPSLDLDEVRDRRTDVVVAPSEPYPFAERHRAELEGVAPTVLVDGRDLLWWGVRTAAALERLGRVLGDGHLSGAGASQ